MSKEDGIWWNECEFVVEVKEAHLRDEIRACYRVVKELKDTERDFPGYGDDVQFTMQFSPPLKVVLTIEKDGQTAEKTATLESWGSVKVGGVLLPVHGDLGFWNGSVLMVFGEKFPLPFRYKAPEFVAALKARNAQTGFNAAQVERDNQDLIESFTEGLEISRGNQIEQLIRNKNELETDNSKLKSKKAEGQKHARKKLAEGKKTPF